MLPLILPTRLPILGRFFYGECNEYEYWELRSESRQFKRGI